MNAKFLLMAASLLLAAISTSMAQVYSQNAVGFVNRTVPANGYCVLSNPLNGTNNHLNTIIPLPNDGTFDGANVYRYNSVNQGYYATMSFVSGLGWLAEDPGDLTINPGEGFFIQNVKPIPMPLMFIGDVPVGRPTRNRIQGNNKYTLTAAIVPKAGPLGWPGLTNSLEFPAADGDSVYIFDCAAQGWKATYAYVTGLGWLHDVDPPEGPYIDVAQGFFVQKLVAPVDWEMTFTVNP